MTGTLRGLLIDHIRRGGWYWLLVGFMQLSAVFNYALARQTTLMTYPMMGAIFAPMILNVAEQRGWFQILLTLPLARRDIARARWWAAIGAPGLFLTALSVAALIVFAALGWKLRPSWQVGLWLLSGWAILGLFAQARSWLRVRPGGALTARRCLVAAAFISLAMLAFFLAGAEGYGRVLAIAATTAGLVVDAYLYWRAERLLFWQVGRARSATSIGKAPSKAPLASSHAGWGALIGQWAQRLALFGVFIAFCLGLFALFDRAQGGGFFAFLLMSFLGLMVVLSCVLSAPWLSAARTFRALPLSTDRLAATFLLLTTAPAWAVLLVIFGVSILFPEAMARAFAPFGLLSVALASLLAPLLLRFGQQKALAWVAIPVIAAPPILDPMVAIFHADLVAAWIRPWMTMVLVIALIAGYLSFVWTRHELRTGRGAYRVAALPGQNVAA